MNIHRNALYARIDRPDLYDVVPRRLGLEWSHSLCAGSDSRIKIPHKPGRRPQPSVMESEFMKFPSRRSTVYSTKGMVALLQPLANAAGLEILDLGGNCVDAAIAALAALCVTEPSSTGIGGDCFAIFYKDG